MITAPSPYLTAQAALALIDSASSYEIKLGMAGEPGVPELSQPLPSQASFV